MKQIHLIMPFSRLKLKDVLTDAYRPMGILLHPIMFDDEAVDWSHESWIEPLIIPSLSTDCKAKMPGTYKRNIWVETQPIIDDDYYVTVDDDDMYEPGVFDKIKQMDDDIVVISMKRGSFIPEGVPEIRRYPPTLLLAHPDTVQIGAISAQQSFVKGKIFKEYIFNEDSHDWDGEIIMHHKATGEQIRYEPNLYALFNFYEPGRWEKIAFGVMVNNKPKLERILRCSDIVGIPCYTIMDPESAAKGLNTLLDVIDSKGAQIGILTHQDMMYRPHWLPAIREQLEMLPDSWIIAGIVGKDMDGHLCGRFHDMSTPLWIKSDHKFPVQCSCIDECTIIVNIKKGFRFDETLEGWDLYGTYAPLRAREMGGTAWILDAWAEHYCSRFHKGWEPDERFMSMWKWLYDRFPGQKLQSTVLID